MTNATATKKRRSAELVAAAKQEAAWAAILRRFGCQITRSRTAPVLELQPRYQGGDREAAYQIRKECRSALAAAGYAPAKVGGSLIGGEDRAAKIAAARAVGGWNL